MGAFGAGGGVAGGVVAVEVCAPLLLLCWLCCWPDDNSDTSSSGKHPKKPVIGHDSGSRRRSSELLARRVASSAVSLHLPGTSGNSKESLSAHRSHEEIPCRRRSNHSSSGQESRYHSAPSVIDEVLHRRDWDRSTRELYIPLRPETDLQQASRSHASSPEPQPENNDEPNRKLACKKHYTNIKSSRNKINKESNREDVKDTDATESVSNFYIGEERTDALIRESGEEIPELVVTDDKIKSVYKAKDDKQSINESIKIKERPAVEGHWSPISFEEDVTERRGASTGVTGRVFDAELSGAELDRSGAWHRAPGSPGRLSLRSAICPPPSVALVGYEGAACYLASPRGSGAETERWARGGGAGRGAERGAERGARARHASDGDILAPTHRPESGAFSESDLDLEPESEELPPPYHELEYRATTHAAATHSHTETAI